MCQSANWHRRRGAKQSFRYNYKVIERSMLQQTVRRVGFNQFTTIPNTYQPRFIKVLDPKTLKVSIISTKN
jgi:hypothetical protein